jgi:hypothetical protein
VLYAKTQPPQKRTCYQKSAAKDVDRGGFDQRDCTQKSDQPEKTGKPLFEDSAKTRH